MGDVDVNRVKSIDPIRIQEIDEIKNIEPLRIAKIAPAAVHVKELNHIDPISIESLRVDEVRNIEPVKIDRFDVTHLPTVNLTLGDVPALDLNLRRVPPFAVGLHQEFVLPSEYFIRARLLGLEILRVHVTGRTLLHPHDQARREVSASHERSYREVAAAGNPAIPVICREESAEVTAPARYRQHAGHGHGGAHRSRQAVTRLSRAGLSVGAPPAAFSLAHRQAGGVESAVSSG